MSENVNGNQNAAIPSTESLESSELKAAHTPGPWATSRDAVPEGYVQVTVYAEAGGERVATVFEREANADLIAAAPALYEALNKLITVAQSLPQPATHDGLELADRLARARAALALVDSK